MLVSTSAEMTVSHRTGFGAKHGVLRLDGDAKRSSKNKTAFNLLRCRQSRGTEYEGT